MTNTELTETIRQMMADWNAATDEQRAELLRQSAAAVEAVLS